ncbi:class I SAM-dependent methyltransferase [Lentisalinibacter sediminis]|uniref:class I SAM-dependent methyltransferase n=1 Tax=Lentisalinibacter sediminis TaxID=2992237 RepID=UPI003868CF52
MKNYLLLPAALLLAACGQPEEASAPATEPTGEPEAAAETASPELAAKPAPERLAEILAAQPEEVQARYEHRHPQETLAFFGIEPGMTVVEALPGGGWYTKIVLPYLGADGRVIGADYALEMFPLFGFFSDEQIKKKETWVEDWTAQAEGWAGDDGAAVSAFVLGSLPEEMKGTADAMLFIRALHNLARFEDEGGYLTAALADTYAVLKPGGVVGVVQHEARPDMPDEWADGSAGYLKQAFVINAFEEAGFELAAESDINANPADQPTTEDVVWRLPPTLATSREDPELREQLQAVGESNRMTLLFRKPAE